MTPAARVVPDVASFSVDGGFWYSIPEHLAADLHIGSIVRVPLSGRKVRGWVVELAEERPGKLKDVAGISGSGPVFNQGLLETLLWSARHYVAPFSTLLGRASPPNLPRATPQAASVPGVEVPPGHALGGLVGRTASDTRDPVVALVANWRRLDWLRQLGPVFTAGKSVLVVAAAAAEVREIRDAAFDLWGDLTAAVLGEDDKTDTEAWEAAQSPPRLVVGTPKTASWQIPGLGLVVVLEEGRRAMKDRQTPTIHVREVIRNRSRVEGFNLAFYGPTPSVELLSAGAEVIHQGNRAWPLVEVVDRTEEQPGGGYLSERTVAAISGVAKANRHVFVFTHRRIAYASMRCTRCRALRICSSCGARVGRVDQCPRCGTGVGPCEKCGGDTFEEMGTIPERLVAEINRRVGHGAAKEHPADSLITVGTERDLAGLAPVELAVAADVDGMLMGIGYRTSEEALRQLARLALSVSRRSGSRLMLQTSRPGSLLVTTMRRGDPIPYLERVLVERAREGSPPAIDMIAIEVRGEIPQNVDTELASLEGAAVMGPMTLERGKRWLMVGKLGKARLQLRTIVGRWRDSGATVRVDVDPIDV